MLNTAEKNLDKNIFLLLLLLVQVGPFIYLFYSNVLKCSFEKFIAFIFIAFYILFTEKRRFLVYASSLLPKRETAARNEDFREPMY
jgi:hypothetical protein